MAVQGKAWMTAVKEREGLKAVDMHGERIRVWGTGREQGR